VREIVCIHGAGESAAVWSEQVAALEQLRALNLPGHGGRSGSPPNSIEGYARWLGEELGEGGQILAGHSMGGAIAMQLTLDSPGLVAGLVLVGTGARLRVDPALLALLDEDFDAGVEIICSRSVAHDPRSREVLRHSLREAGRDVVTSDLRACDGFDVMQRIQNIDTPTLVIVGEADRMTPPKYAQYLHTHIAGSELEVVPDAGHLVMLERSHEVSDAIRLFRQRQVDPGSAVR
jgi:pimeloyl-ACP methyl ester carboxylesterase